MPSGFQKSSAVFDTLLHVDAATAPVHGVAVGLKLGRYCAHTASMAAWLGGFNWTVGKRASAAAPAR